MTHRQARFLFGPLLLGAVVGLVWLDLNWHPVSTSIVAVALALVGLVEFTDHMSRGRIGRDVKATLLSGSLLFLVVVAALGDGWLAFAPAVLLGPACALMARRWRAGPEAADLDEIARCALGLAIIVWPLGCLVALFRHVDNGVLFAVVVVVGSKLNDIGGYLVGSAIGRNKLCPGISPNKSWEGAIGGLVLGAAGTVLMLLWIEPLAGMQPLLATALFGLGLGLVTQAGDLFESLLKRSADVKDSGALIPAFGGVLDLIDSLIFAAPLGYAVGLHWLGPA